MLNEIQYSEFEKEIRIYTFRKQNSNKFLSFSPRKLHKNYQMSGEINSHICLMLSVYESFHQKVKYDKAKKSYITRFSCS